MRRRETPRDLAGRRGDTELPHSRARFDAEAASADAMKKSKKRIEAAVFLLLLPILVLTVVIPKSFIDRPRPEGTLEGLTDSFPSGTGTVSILLLGFLIFLVGEFVESRRLRIAVQVALGVVIVLLGLFRMLAGEHWPSDIYGGYMAGGLALIVVIWVYRRLRGRRT